MCCIIIITYSLTLYLLLMHKQNEVLSTWYTIVFNILIIML